MSTHHHRSSPVDRACERLRLRRHPTTSVYVLACGALAAAVAGSTAALLLAGLLLAAEVAVLMHVTNQTGREADQMYGRHHRPPEPHQTRTP